jgi:hypothetical protein
VAWSCEEHGARSARACAGASETANANASSAPVMSPEGDDTATKPSSSSTARAAIRSAPSAIHLSIPRFYLKAPAATASGSLARHTPAPMLRPRLSYANVVSSLALFIALGGTGYAVTQLPRNSVGNRQLKSNAVSSGKIRARAVQRSDLAPNARIGARGARGPTGPTGPLGPSETIQVNRPGVVGIPAGAGGAATIASLTLGPGSWLLDANTTVVYNPGVESSDYFECLLQKASGDILVKGIMRGGATPGSVFAGHVPVRTGASFTVATQVNFLCRHDNAVSGNAPYADRTTFQATRVGSLTDR